MICSTQLAIAKGLSMAQESQWSIYTNAIRNNFLFRICGVFKGKEDKLQSARALKSFNLLC